MPQKTKKVHYMIKVEKLEVECGFGINSSPSDSLSEHYSEYSSIVLLGRVLSPALKDVNKAKVIIRGAPQLEDHWKSERKDPPTATGWIELPKGSDILEMHGLFPFRTLPFILTAVAAGKIGYASIYGTKLRYRKGDVFEIDLFSGQRDHADE